MDDVSWIDEAGAVAEFCDAIPQGEVVAVDTESDHFFAYHARVALIQIATRDATALIDPLALDVPELEPFFELLEDPSVTKILHSCRNDIRELDRDFRVDVINVFDTQLAARFAGNEKFSLRNLLDDHLDVQISKKYQRFDWTRRPIPEGPKKYAAGDVIHLFDLRDELLEAVEDAGWMEAYEQQCAYIAANSGYEATPFDPTDWRRLKGARGADPQTRATLRALFEWRHDVCERLNRAALHVFTNGALVHTAKARPTSMGDLRDVRGLKDFVRRDFGDELLDVIRESLDAEPPPARPPRSDESGPSREERNRQGQLKGLRTELHNELGLPRHLLISRHAIEEIARVQPGSLEDLREIDELLPWQAERFGQQILGTLR